MTGGKQHFREKARCVRDSLTPENSKTLSRAICDRLIDILDGESPVLVYVSKEGEVDTQHFISRLLGRGTEVVVPIIERENRKLRLSYLRDPAVLSPSTFSVPEPIGHEIPADPENIRVVIIPMIAFDRHGHRLGYGAGYYDRFLSSHSHMKKIGVAFSCQEMETIPADRNDVRMDIIVTEKGVIEV
ncbi:MAG TPA: 5-formyltetrahydrofolate cyclo-ligase [Methanoregulaceae archaeon]|nr:5-formyltetrahydrofolate cyclo-ligase [Methanoregulaceae archaeon]